MKDDKNKNQFDKGRKDNKTLTAPRGYIYMGLMTNLD
jgi:hypothetical protein